MEPTGAGQGSMAIRLISTMNRIAELEFMRPSDSARNDRVTTAIARVTARAVEGVAGRVGEWGPLVKLGLDWRKWVRAKNPGISGQTIAGHLGETLTQMCMLHAVLIATNYDAETDPDERRRLLLAFAAASTKLGNTIIAVDCLIDNGSTMISALAQAVCHAAEAAIAHDGPRQLLVRKALVLSAQHADDTVRDVEAKLACGAGWLLIALVRAYYVRQRTELGDTPLLPTTLQLVRFLIRDRVPAPASEISASGTNEILWDLLRREASPQHAVALVEEHNLIELFAASTISEQQPCFPRGKDVPRLPASLGDVRPIPTSLVDLAPSGRARVYAVLPAIYQRIMADVTSRVPTTEDQSPADNLSRRVNGHFAWLRLVDELRLKPPPLSGDRCAWIDCPGTSTAKMMACARCSTRFCGKPCYTAAWKAFHKSACPDVALLRR